MRNGVREWTIEYRYKGQLEVTDTKPCTYAQALEAFEVFNSTGSFKLVRIVPAS